MTSICTNCFKENITDGKIEVSLHAIPAELRDGFELTSEAIIESVDGIIEIRPYLPCSSSTYREMINIFGSYKKAMQWFTTSNKGLNGKKPIELYEEDFNEAEIEIDLLLLQTNTNF